MSTSCKSLDELQALRKEKKESLSENTKSQKELKHLIGQLENGLPSKALRRKTQLENEKNEILQDLIKLDREIARLKPKERQVKSIGEVLREKTIG